MIHIKENRKIDFFNLLNRDKRFGFESHYWRIIILIATSSLLFNNGRISSIENV